MLHGTLSVKGVEESAEQSGGDVFWIIFDHPEFDFVEVLGLGYAQFTNMI